MMVSIIALFPDPMHFSRPFLFKLRKSLTILCVGTLALALNTQAADTSDVVNNSPEIKSETAHSAADEAAKTKKHRLSKLKERLNIDEETLKNTCRYESDISLAPPAKEIALTFDDGPEPVQTEFILAILKKHKIPATFFMIGEKVQAHPELVKLVQESNDGLIANHSWSHPNFHEITPEEQALEINKSNAISEEFNTHQLFRYPYGNSSCESNQLLKSLNQKIVGWHVDSCDWAFDHKGSVDLKEALSCGVLPQNRKDYLEHVISSVHAHNGGIVLMHEIHPNTLKSLDEIITRLQAEGYVFKSLADEDFQKFLR